MTKNQLKEAVKSVVRECLNERVIKEVAPPGDKAERMVQHVKASLKKSHPDWDAEKVASVAIATAWKAHNKGSVEQDECGGMEEGADSKVSMLDDIVRGIMKLAPAIKDNPDKVAKVAALFFHRRYGKPADGDALMQAVERNMGYADQVADSPLPKDEEEEEETIGEPAKEESEEQDECGASCEEEEEGKSEEEESTSHEEEEEESVNEASAKTLPPNKGQYKVATARQYTTTDQNKALTVQTDPEVNEEATPTLPPNKGQYKTVAPHQYTTTSQNKPLTIQTDPKVNEAGLTSEKGIKFSSLVNKKKQGLAKENHRVQTRSYVTVKDNPNDPNVMRDPENPQSNGA